MCSQGLTPQSAFVSSLKSKPQKPTPSPASTGSSSSSSQPEKRKKVQQLLDSTPQDKRQLCPNGSECPSKDSEHFVTFRHSTRALGAATETSATTAPAEPVKPKSLFSVDG